LHRLGIHIEEYVLADGSYPQDHLLRWLDKKLDRQGRHDQLRPLWSDDEVILDVADRYRSGAALSEADLAKDYTYPMEYISEVLMGRIETYIHDKHRGGK
jgi:hypothetical protein